ncbi:MAG: 3-hydroxy-3-methylglutaryl-CoA reductase [Marinilabiliales bacterium]|nr:MAG: 3-hydroxy-3-methylglutaryl-CoA reductase [Marinilabiliales bacterium]
MKLPKDRKNNYSENAIKDRISFLSKRSGCSIRYLQSSIIDTELTRGNIENIIGFSQVPVGAVGPLKVNGKYANGDFYVPLSTSEGALISSYNRGARVVSLSGGANVVLVKDSIQRAPFFELENVFKSGEFVEWINKNFNKLREVAESTTDHGKLLDYSTYIQGKIVFLRLSFSTGDAMGMNMISKASEKLCAYISENFPVVRWAIESNMAVDKKPAHINSILGRGKTVTADVLIKEHVISRFLRTTAEEIDKTYRQMVMGDLLAGVLGMNGHIANGVAALFLACGQDLANISESCVGYSYAEAMGKDLYVSLNLPSLVVGTVGGGVSLPTQRECLEIIGCYGRGKSKKFAEIVAATILAGEISLISAIVAGDFIKAHERYGRNNPLSDPGKNQT